MFRFFFREDKPSKLPLFLFLYKNYIHMVEPLLSGIVLGLVPVTLTGLFVTAYLQYRRGDLITSSF